MRFVVWSLVFVAALFCRAADRPNIIWIVGEDLGPELGCYGDAYSHTPNIDKLASEGARFTRAFTHAPVCAPSRSGLITGRYPTSIGTHHMRSKLLKPPATFTQRLRECGYHVSWPGKTDFNFDAPREAFDATNHNWRRQLPPQPFFAYVNLGTTHESQIRGTAAQFAKNTAKLKSADRHDPAKATLPPYYPETPETRRDWANYYDLITAVDYQVAEVLADIERHGIASNTVVFFFGDHGRGLPRAKRWIYDSGIHVPLIVRWPGQIKPATMREDLVAFVDFAPTVLSLAGCAIQKDLDGQVFLGPNRAADRKYIYAARDRMDEAYDRIRCVRDTRFKYIRNFHPELPYAQRIDYMEEMPTTRVWRELNAAGKLKGPQTLWFSKNKPREEFYDLENDPHEINNLADSQLHRVKLDELRGALDRWIADTHDMGAIPETELIARGLVADKLSEYKARIKPLPENHKL
jgi:N-sulfoglucosamine sulfohydrolase